MPASPASGSRRAHGHQRSFVEARKHKASHLHEDEVELVEVDLLLPHLDVVSGRVDDDADDKVTDTCEFDVSTISARSGAGDLTGSLIGGKCSPPRLDELLEDLQANVLVTDDQRKKSDSIKEWAHLGLCARSLLEDAGNPLPRVLVLLELGEDLLRHLLVLRREKSMFDHRQSEIRQTRTRHAVKRRELVARSRAATLESAGLTAGGPAKKACTTRSRRPMSRSVLKSRMACKKSERSLVKWLSDAHRGYYARPS